MGMSTASARLVARQDMSFASCPTRSLLAHAYKAGKASSPIDLRVKERLLTVGAVGMAVIEAGSYAMRGATMAAINTCTTITGLILRAFSIAVWVALGWVSDQLLTKSTLRWVQFVALQVWLALGNHTHWWAQWKLWANIQYSMTASAQGAAASADALARWTEKRVSSTEAFACLQRSVDLTLFALGAIPHLMSKPENVHTLYGKSVETWPPRNVFQAIGQQLHRRRWAIGVWTTVAVLAAAHLKLEGYDYRMGLLNQTADHLWNHSGTVLNGGLGFARTTWSVSGGALWKWWTNSPNWNVINEAFKNRTEELNRAKEAYEELKRANEELLNRFNKSQGL